MKSRIGPDGLHLFDRNSGLNVLLSDVRPVVETRSDAPRQVSIALTNACDLQCAYCYAPKYKASLHLEQVIDWLKELDQYGCFGVGFGGGEPTLHREFVEICQRAASETQLGITFTTHGHRLNEDMIERLKGSVHFVRISVDGVGATYEHQRGRKFARLLEGIKLISTLSPFGINVVVNEHTVSSLEALSDLASEWGASELLLLPQQSTGSVAGMEEVVGHTLQRWVSRYTGDVQLAVSESGASGLPICNPLSDEDSLKSYAHVDASGIVRTNSYSPFGERIDEAGIISALEKLKRSVEKL